ncbi:hypothetical protein MBRU_19175 [Mycolicibacterium brumae DSM 44177]|nr:hypothetical protein MBRU_19175 [Mycolicibacterium brumae DSM 44177]
MEMGNLTAESVVILIEFPDPLVSEGKPLP